MSRLVLPIMLTLATAAAPGLGGESIGWRGNGSGVHLGVDPPLRWQRVSTAASRRRRRRRSALGSWRSRQRAKARRLRRSWRAVAVRDLFYATPARLKFLKSARSELGAAADALKRLAMAHPDVAFSLVADGKKVFAYAAEIASETGRLRRLGAVMGGDFEDNAVRIEAGRESARLSGYAGAAHL